MPERAGPRRRFGARSLAPIFAIAAFCALLIAGVAAVTLERISYERGDAVREATRLNTDLAGAFAAHVLRSLQAADLALQIARREYERGGRELGLGADGPMDARLFNELAVVDEQGRVRLSGGRMPPLDVGGGDWLAQHRASPDGGLQVGAAVSGLGGGSPRIVISRPIAGRDGSLAGVALATVAPDYFLSFAPGVEFGPKSLLQLAGLDGAVRARLAGGELTAGQKLRDSALLSAARQKREGSLVGTDEDGVARYLSYRVLEAYPLLVAVGSGVEETLAPFRARERGYVRNAWLATIAILLFAASLISAWVILDRSEEQFRQLAAHIPEVFWMTDLRGRACYLSPAFRDVSGLPPQPAAQAWQAWRELIHPQDRTLALDAYARPGASCPEIDHRIMRPDGSERWVRARSFPVLDASGVAYRIAGTLEDVTARRKAEEKLLYDAQFDALTDLPNRLVCQDRLERALAQAQRKSWGMAVLFVDLDRFKTVNDMLGHAIGDGALRQAAQRLGHCVRAGDTVARIGGDEFAVVLAEVGRADDAGAVAQKIIDAMAAPMQIDGHEVFVSASVGIAAFPADGHDSDTLLKNADAAMLKAKEAGRATYQFYTAAMNARAMEKLNLENDLRRALERDEFQLHYQPKQDLKNGRIAGLEALLRWRHPALGLMSPAQFVPLLEDSGLIVKVGDWVVRAACRQIAAWQQAGVPAVPVAVNLAAKQFLHHDLTGTIESALEVGIDPALLALEITESDIMQRPEEVVAMLRKLKLRGIAVSIDDFGTGYSSLAYLKRLPVDALKLDRSFVIGLPGDADDVAIARAVIGMAHSLGLEVIAEGVETEAQRAFLVEWGCDQLQGYLLSKPLAPAECEAFLRAHAAQHSTAGAPVRELAV